MTDGGSSRFRHRVSKRVDGLGHLVKHGTDCHGTDCIGRVVDRGWRRLDDLLGRRACRVNHVIYDDLGRINGIVTSGDGGHVCEVNRRLGLPR